jgi:transcriptional regulator with XRE-family HTH domain
MQIRKLIGRKLKAIRLENNLTIQELSTRSRVSCNMISRIERGLTIPSVEILIKLGTVFNKSVNYFVAELETCHEIVYSRPGERPRTVYDDNRHLQTESMTGGLRDPQFTSFVCTVNKNGNSGNEPMYHPGDELIHVLEGTLKVVIAGETYHLGSGDSLSFKAHLPHLWENVGQDVATVVWTLSQIHSIF